MLVMWSRLPQGVLAPLSDGLPEALTYTSCFFVFVLVTSQTPPLELTDCVRSTQKVVFHTAKTSPPIWLQLILPPWPRLLSGGSEIVDEQ
jgi:hypothetical protein